MQKGLKQMLALCGAAVVLGGAYAGLTVWNSYSEKKKTEAEQEAAEAAKIYLCSSETPIALEVTNENGTFSFTYDEEAEKWGYDKDKNFPLLQSKITSITSKIKSLEAVRRLDGADEDLSLYGLDNPSCRLEIAEEDQEPVALDIGDASEASGDYYLKLDGDDSIYTVSSAFVTALTWTEDEILEKETFPTITASNINTLTWQRDGETVSYHQETREAEVTEAETESEDTAAEDTAEETTAAQSGEGEQEAEKTVEETTEAEPETEEYWVCGPDSDGEEVEDTANLESVLTSITGISFADCADYYMEDSEKEAYGMDEASAPAVLTVYYTSGDEEKALVLTIGALTEDESAYYVVLNNSDFSKDGGSRMINTAAKDTIDAVMGFFED